MGSEKKDQSTNKIQEAVKKALDWVVEVDVDSAKSAVEDLRRKYRKASNKQLANRIFSKARLKATAAGVVSGLPANPWVAGPAGLAEVAVTVRTEVNAAARVALLYDPEFFEEEDAAWELLLPIFGLNATSQFVRTMAIRGGMGITRQAIKKHLSKETLKQFKKIVLKYFGLKVTQKGFITKTLPVVGGAIGGAWNWIEVTAVKSRTVAWFEGKELL